jgi:hypothetical protein
MLSGPSGRGFDAWLDAQLFGGSVGEDEQVIAP